MKSHLHIKNSFSFLSIGSNVGNLKTNIDKSVKLLNANKNITIQKISNYYLSEPLYYKNQNDFLNIVISISTNLSVDKLLKTCKSIELNMGRVIDAEKNYPRIIDIDILTYDHCIFNSEDLNIPHLKICERKFVLKPWCDIDPEFILPKLNKKIKLLLKNVKDNSKIIKLEL